MDWFTDVIPLLLIGILQMALAFVIGAYLLRTKRERGGRQ